MSEGSQGIKVYSLKLCDVDLETLLRPLSLML